MTFAEKLDLLMNITNTSNSLLSRKISIDASYISRLRRGVRTPAKNVSYIQSMSEYFARCCHAEYQKTALWEAIKDTSLVQPQQSGTMGDLIFQWLQEPKETVSNSIDNFLEGMINCQFKKIETGSTAAGDVTYDREVSEIEMFYGMEGKQAAILTFLSLVLQNKKPQTLLLYSDEDIGWLTDSPEFTAQWATLMLQVLKNGNRIKIVHTVNRHLDEMLSGIKRWVPVYITGNIEPFYYPKTRDGLFRRTLFIAPETAAITSSSVRSNTREAANLLFTNKEAIRALITEFNHFLALCRPLMHIFNPLNNRNLVETLTEFEEEEGNTVISSDVLTNITMPPEVMLSMLTRTDDPDNRQLLSFQQHRIRNFYYRLLTNTHMEIFPLADLETLLAGKVGVNFSDIPNKTQLFYSPEEYYQHLQHIIHLLQTYDNYRVLLTVDNHLKGCMVYVKEDVGVLVGKTSPPSTIFAINENNMTTAFWDYMDIVMHKDYYVKMEHKLTIIKLISFTSQLTNVLNSRLNSK